MLRAALHLDRHGWITEAKRAYEGATARGESGARVEFAQALRAWGEVDASEAQLRLALGETDRAAVEALASLLAAQDRPHEAEVLLREQVARGRNEYALQLADVLAHPHIASAEAEHWYAIALAEGDPCAPNNYGVYLLDHDRLDEAAVQLGAGAQAGDALAVANLGRVRVQQQQFAEGISLLLDALMQGECNFVLDLAEAYVGHGEVKAAESIYCAAIRAGIDGARNDLANMLSELGRMEEAEKLYRDGMAHGEHDASWNLALLLEGSGRIEEALDAYRLAADAGHGEAHLNLAELLERQGDEAGASTEYLRALDGGDESAWVPYAAFLQNTGQPEALELLLHQAYAAGLPESVTSALARQHHSDGEGP